MTEYEVTSGRVSIFIDALSEEDALRTVRLDEPTLRYAPLEVRRLEAK